MQTVYTCIALLQVMRLAIGKHFARAMEAGPEAWVALKRMERFLTLPEAALNTNMSSEGGADGAMVVLEKASFTRPIVAVPLSSGKAKAKAKAKKGYEKVSVKTEPATNDGGEAKGCDGDKGETKLDVDGEDGGDDGGDGGDHGDGDGEGGGSGGGGPALNEISLSLTQGQVLMVTGPVGCGKTTLVS